MDLFISAFPPQKGDSLLELNQRLVSRPCWGPWFAILASAARTATTYSPRFTTPHGASGLQLCLEVSVAGTSTLTPNLLNHGTDDTTANSYITTSVAVSSAIRRFIQVAPGIGALSGMAMANNNSFVGAYLWPIVAFVVTHGDASSWTYRLDGRYLYGS